MRYSSYKHVISLPLSKSVYVEENTLKYRIYIILHIYIIVVRLCCSLCVKRDTVQLRNRFCRISPFHLCNTLYSQYLPFTLDKMYLTCDIFFIIFKLCFQLCIVSMHVNACNKLFIPMLVVVVFIPMYQFILPLVCEQGYSTVQKWIFTHFWVSPIEDSAQSLSSPTQLIRYN